MSYKDELLKFLYNSSSSRTGIHTITDNNGYSNKEIKETISDLKKDKIIDTDDKYRQIGCGDPKSLMTSKSLKITARLTPRGEKYVRETYFKEENEKTFSAQIVYVNGDNSGQIAQADNQSESRLETKTKTIVPVDNNKNIFREMFSNKRIVEIIIGVTVIVLGYFVMNWLGINDKK